jgi:hypothetical protein
MTIESNPSMPFGLYVTSSATAVAAPSTLMFPTGLEMLPTGLEDWLKANARAYLMTLELPSDVLEWIGKIVSYWAFAEWTQVATLARLLGISLKEARVMFGPRIGNAISKIRQLMEMKNIPLPPDFDDLLRQLSKCEEARNLLGHGVWMRDGTEVCVQNTAGVWVAPKQTVSRRKYPEAVYPDALWFSERLTEIETATIGLQALGRYIDAALPPSGGNTSVSG